jgi:hypothetical protein
MANPYDLSSRPSKEQRARLGGEARIAALQARLAAAEAAQREAVERVRVLALATRRMDGLIQRLVAELEERAPLEGSGGWQAWATEELLKDGTALAPATPATDAGDAQEGR